MSKSNWNDVEIAIAPPGTPESEWLFMPIHGTPQPDANLIMKEAFRCAETMLLDTKNVSEQSQIILCALSCELFLKSIIMDTIHKQVRGHDLYELFFSLQQKE